MCFPNLISHVQSSRNPRLAYSEGLACNNNKHRGGCSSQMHIRLRFDSDSNSIPLMRGCPVDAVLLHIWEGIGNLFRITPNSQQRHRGIFNVHKTTPAEGTPGLTSTWYRRTCDTPGLQFIAGWDSNPSSPAQRRVHIAVGYILTAYKGYFCKRCYMWRDYAASKKP